MSKIEFVYETPSSLPVKRIKVPGGWLYKWGSNDSSPVFVADLPIVFVDGRPTKRGAL